MPCHDGDGGCVNVKACKLEGGYPAKEMCWLISEAHFTYPKAKIKQIKISDEDGKLLRRFQYNDLFEYGFQPLLF